MGRSAPNGASSTTAPDAHRNARASAVHHAHGAAPSRTLHARRRRRVRAHAAGTAAGPWAAPPCARACGGVSPDWPRPSPPCWPPGSRTSPARTELGKPPPVVGRLVRRTARRRKGGGAGRGGGVGGRRCRRWAFADEAMVMATTAKIMLGLRITLLLLFSGLIEAKNKMPRFRMVAGRTMAKMSHLPPKSA